MFTLTEEDAVVLSALQVDDTVLRRYSYGWGAPRWTALKITRITATMLVINVARYLRHTGRRVGAHDPWTDRIFPDTSKFREQMVEDEATYQRAQRIANARNTISHRVSWGSVPLDVLEGVVELLHPYVRS